MNRAGGLVIGLAAAALAAPAVAGPWTQPKGRAQVIFKFEDMRADRGFDPDDQPRPGSLDQAREFAAYVAAVA